MNIFRRELKVNLRGFLIWGVSLGLLVFVIMAVFPSIAGEGKDLDQVLDLYPEEIIKIFGLDQMSLGDPLGFYGSEAYFMVALVGGIYAAILGAGMLAKEEEDKTIEFLLARPVTRARILWEKAFAWLICLILLNVIIGVFAWLAFLIINVGEYSLLTLLALIQAPLFIHITFASLGFTLAMFIPRRRGALSVSIGLVLGSYFLNAISLLNPGLEFLGWLTPFRHMDAAPIVEQGAVSIGHTAILLAFSGLLIVLSCCLYRRRDIT